jgi:hypothetical protein
VVGTDSGSAGRGAESDDQTNISELVEHAYSFPPPRAESRFSVTTLQSPTRPLEKQICGEADRGVLAGAAVNIDFNAVAAAKDDCKIKNLFSALKNLSLGGSTLNIEGISGSIGTTGIAQIFNSVPGSIQGKYFFDFGSGSGIMLIAALLLGASGAAGIELMANMSVLSPLFYLLLKHFNVDHRVANIAYGNITRLESIPAPAEVIWSFWDGLPIDVRDHIIFLVSKCHTANVFACSSANLENKGRVLSVLNLHSGSESWNIGPCFLALAHGSTMKRQIWVFLRKCPLTTAQILTHSTQT